MRLSKHQRVRMSECQSIGGSDCYSVRGSGCQIVKVSDDLTIRLSECLCHGLDGADFLTQITIGTALVLILSHSPSLRDRLLSDDSGLSIVGFRPHDFNS
jgi:hypothetical protein